MKEQEGGALPLMDREALRKRLELAAEFVSEGGGMRVLKLSFASGGDDVLIVCGYTRCYDIERLTKRRALGELQRTRDFFDDVLEICPDFMERCQRSKVVFALVDNYRTGGFGICDDINGEIIWRVDLKEG